MSAVPTYEVLLTTPGGDAVIDVPSYLGAEAAARRARWTAISLGWGEPDEIKAITSVRLPQQVTA